MKFWIVFFLLAGAMVVRGQFYAPATHFHDPVQRLFPVEAARVVAWLAGQEDDTQVKWEIESRLNGPVNWKLMWVDSHGAVVREANLTCTPEDLKSGAAWFRKVWKEVASPWNLSLTGDDKTLREAFWRGMHAAESAGTRMARVETARKFAAANSPHGSLPNAAELAGVMTQAGVMTLASPMTLDYLVLARAAAWLAYAETALPQPAADLWAPLLYLTGRVPLAREAWLDAPAGEKPSLLQRTWGLALKKNTVRDWVEHVATPGQARVGLPFFAEATTLHGSGLWPQVWRECFTEETRRQLHDYQPRVSETDSKTTSQMVQSKMVLQARREVVEQLNRLGPFAEADAALLVMVRPEVGDKALTQGLAELAPLTKRGFDPQRRPLRPVATVSAEDLLMHLWDSEMMQLNAYVQALKRLRSNARGLVEKLALAVGDSVPDFALHAKATLGRDPSGAEVEPPRNGPRAEMLGSYNLLFYAFPSLNESLRSKDSPEADEDYLHRFWLVRNGGVTRVLFAFHALPEPRMSFRDYASRVVDEGGPVHAFMLYNFLAGHGAPRSSGRLLADEAFMRRLNDMSPDLVVARYQLSKRSWLPGWHSLQVAQAAEECFWQAPDTFDLPYVFWRYVEAGAFDAAKRFYSQVRELHVDEGDLTTMLAPSRWTLAWLEDDRAAMEAALADSKGHDLLVFNHALAIGDDETAMATIDKAIIQHEEKGRPIRETPWTRLKAAMVPVPHLANADAPAYADALVAIKKDYMWVEFPWILQKRFELPPEDTLKMLSRPAPAAEEQKAFLFYAQQDRKAFEDKFRLCVGSSLRDGFWRVILPWMRLQVRGEKPLPPEQQPDLRPQGGVETLSALIHRLRGSK